MTILLTGGTGFIGSAIAEYFADSDNNLVLVTRIKSKERQTISNHQISYASGDLQDPEFVEEVFRQFKPSVVIHAAWEGVLRKDRESSMQTTILDILGNILKSAVKHNLETFIGIGSQDEYGIHNKKIDESAWPKPLTMYGLTKLAIGLSSLQYAKEADLNFAWLRLFSSFGPGNHEDYLVPHTIISLINGRAPKLTSCEQLWDYLYVKDIPLLIEKIINHSGRFCDIYNLCSGKPTRIRDVVNIIVNILDSSVKPGFGKLPDRENNLFHLEGDNGRFKEQFGWIELTSLRTALEETVDWYQKL